MIWEFGFCFKELIMFRIRRLLSIAGLIIAIATLYQLFVLYGSGKEISMTVSSAIVLNNSHLISGHLMYGEATNENASHVNGKAWKDSNGKGDDRDYVLALDDDGEIESSFEADKETNSSNEFASVMGLTSGKNLTTVNFRSMDNFSAQEMIREVGIGNLEEFKKSDINSTENGNSSGKWPNFSPRTSTSGIEYLDADSITSVLSLTANMSSAQTDSNLVNTELLQTVVMASNISMVADDSMMMKMGMKSTSVSLMNLLSPQNSFSTKTMRPRWPSARDRELQNAWLQIKKAPKTGNIPGLYVSLFRNISMFKRSYELMERTLKVYIYNEGEKPIFHQPHMRGIYASEGWFMKLMEGNKQFVVRDPRKAHLFYLPFSSVKLRSALGEKRFSNQKDLVRHLKDYVAMIARKYRYWNRTSGTDHFLVACHDWAPRFTRNNMGGCIRALCNSNIARGFKIGKDVSLPVTYVRSSQEPHKDLGGNPPSERPILAFFAGGMHGYLRPILLQYWNNKEPDMQIFGSMPRDIEGKARYRQFMKSSKYCICARGYEVHTPRVVESIHFDCVPVIISDNYLPPFYEILNWEAFSVFILEKYVPHLRNILLSIPQEKYLEMQHNVKMVQQHFLWHKKPVKYDLFHMILHSVWLSRVFQMNPG